MPKVINLFAGPGAGKSTTAAAVFAELKMQGINCELVREFAKDKVWEKSFGVLNDQLYILGKQNHRMQTLMDPKDELEVIVTDSPLILSSVYNENLGPVFDMLTLDTFSSYDNMNYFIKRVKPYNPKGRTQNEEEAKEVDQKVLDTLLQYDIKYKTVTGDRAGIADIVNDVMEAIKSND
jgi:hypothetical protein